MAEHDPIERRLSRVEAEQKALFRAHGSLRGRVEQLEDGASEEQRVERRVLTLIPAIALVLAAIIAAVGTIIASGGHP